MNPIEFIDRMPGQEFLIFYVVITVLTLIAVHLTLDLTDPSATLEPARVPARPDPYEVAYLRGGENEVARLAILELVDEGHVVIEERKRWLQSTRRQLVQKGAGPDPESQAPFQKVAWRWFRTPKEAKDIFANALPKELEDACRGFKTRLEAEQLLTDGVEAMGRSLLVGLIAAAALGSIALLKLYTAIDEGRGNIELLLIAGGLSMVFLWQACSPDRLSQRGKDYIKALQLAYESLRPGAVTTSMFGAQARYASGWGDFGPTLPITRPEPTNQVFAAGVFGFAALAGPKHETLRMMFSQSASSGGCGAACGGCGGCGGCGCG